MITTKRQYFMTIAQIEEAVINQITQSVADATTLMTALQDASNTIQARYPAASLHYAAWLYQTLAGQWIAQIEISHGEASVLQHWDLALSLNATSSNGAYVVDVSSITTYDYGQPASALSSS